MNDSVPARLFRAAVYVLMCAMAVVWLLNRHIILTREPASMRMVWPVRIEDMCK